MNSWSLPLRRRKFKPSPVHFIWPKEIKVSDRPVECYGFQNLYHLHFQSGRFSTSFLFKGDGKAQWSNYNNLKPAMVGDSWLQFFKKTLPTLSINFHPTVIISGSCLKIRKFSASNLHTWFQTPYLFSLRWNKVGPSICANSDSLLCYHPLLLFLWLSEYLPNPATK